MRRSPLWLRAYALLLAALLVTPIAIVVVVAFTPSEFVTFPPPGLSLRWFAKVLAEPDFLLPMWNSVRLAAATTAASLLLAVPAALALARYGGRWRAALEPVILAPLSLPAIILAIGLLFLCSRVGLADTFAGLLAGHVVVTLPYAFRTVFAVARRVNHEVEEAAAMLGAPPLRVFWHATLPAVRSGIVAGGIFAFLVSFDEVAVALLMTTGDDSTLPVSILNYLVYNYDPSVAAISALQIGVVVVALLILESVFGLDRVMLPAR